MRKKDLLIDTTFDPCQFSLESTLKKKIVVIYSDKLNAPENEELLDTQRSWKTRTYRSCLTTAVT